MLNFHIYSNNFLENLGTNECKISRMLLLTCKVQKKQTTKLHLQFLKNFQYILYYVEKSKTRGHYEPSPLDLQYLPIQLLLCLALYGLNLSLCTVE